MTTTSLNLLPPELLAKAAEAIAVREDWNYEYPGVEARAEKLAEAALLAADVPGLLSLQATSNLFIQAVGRAASDTGWRKDGNETPGIADWIRLVARERDEVRAALAAIEKRLAEKCTATCMTTEDYTVIMEARRVLGSKERS